MADQVMTAGTELADIVPEVWSAAFYPTLLEALPFNDSVARDYEGEINALGDTVHIPSVPQFGGAQEIAEDEKVDADGVTISTTPLVINKQVAKDFILTKKALRQSIDAQTQLRSLAIFSLMKKMQEVIIAETVASASAPDHQIPYDSGTTMALADLLEGKELLDTANVPDAGQRRAILGSAQWNDLFNISGFTSRDFIPAGSPLTSGQITTPILGFQPRMTTAVGNVAYLFDPIYLQLAVQQLPEVEVFNLGGEGKRATRVNMDVLFGVKQVSNVRVVEIG